MLSNILLKNVITRREVISPHQTRPCTHTQTHAHKHMATHAQTQTQHEQHKHADTEVNY